MGEGELKYPPGLAGRTTSVLLVLPLLPALGFPVSSVTMWTEANLQMLAVGFYKPERRRWRLG